MIKKAPKRLIIDLNESIHSKVREICGKKRETIKDFITGMIVKEIIKIEYRREVEKNI